jgi:hypothetical protein
MAEPWDVKLDRADEHVRELQHSIRELLDSGDFAAITDPTGTERSVRLVIRSEIPARLSAIVGDIVHNLRSALDCVALATCEVGHGGPLSDAEERGVYFPITQSESHFNQVAPRYLPHAEPQHVDLIRFWQPWYDAVTDSGLTEEQRQSLIRHHDLNTLADLSNIDKHRRLHLTTWYPSHIYAGAPEGLEVRWRRATAPLALGDGAVVGQWILVGPEADTAEFHAYAEVELTLQRHLDFGWGGLDVHRFLERMAMYVRSVVMPLARTIGRT